MNGNEVIGTALAQVSNATISSQMTASFSLVNLIAGTAALSADLGDWWNELSRKYTIAMFKSVSDPSGIPLATAAYAAYQEGQQEGQNQLTKQDAVMQSNKAVIKTLGTAMDQMYSLAEGPLKALKAISRIVEQLGN